MNIFEIHKLAETKIKKNDITFNEQVEVVTGILRSMGILSHKRMGENGYTHKLFASVIVLAQNLGEAIHVQTRKCETFADNGLSTVVIKWLDKCVQYDLLTCESPKCIAEGKLFVGQLINNWCNTYTPQQKQQSSII
jgi:hypothetical protein